MDKLNHLRKIGFPTVLIQITTVHLEDNPMRSIPTITKRLELLQQL
jgi:hypothetical protein